MKNIPCAANMKTKERPNSMSNNLLPRADLWKNIKIVIAMVVCWLILIPIVIVLSPFLLVVYVARSVEDFTFKALYNTLPFNAEDSVWLFNDSGNHPNINGLLIMETRMTIENARTIMSTRLVNSFKENVHKSTLKYPRATRYVREGFLNYHWMEEENFQIEKHVFEHSKKTCYESERQIQNIASRLAARPLVTKEKLSPWELILFHFKDEEGMERSAMLFRCNHALSDGVALMYFITNEVSDKRHKFNLPEEHNKLTCLQKWFLTLKSTFLLPYNAYIQTQKDIEVKTSFNREKTCGRKHFGSSKPISLELIKEVKRTLNVSVNDVMIGLLAASIQNYLQERNEGLPRNFTLAFAINARLDIEEAKEFGNKIGAGLLPLDMTSNDPIKHILGVNQNIRVIKENLVGLSLRSLIRALQYFVPSFILDVVNESIVQNVNVTSSNIHGPERALYLRGNELHSLKFWPPTKGNTSITTSIISYKGNMVTSVACDENATDNPGEILANLGTIIDTIAHRLEIRESLEVE